MKKGKRTVKIQINFTNRWLYTFIAVFLLAAVAVGVYALAPGVVPNPGHNINEVSVPSPCTSGQFLQYNNSDWKCSSVFSLPACPAGTTLSVVWSLAGTGEDSYGSFVVVGDCDSWRCNIDTCDGNYVNEYGCPVGTTKTCTDVYIDKPYNCHYPGCGSSCDSGTASCGCNLPQGGQCYSRTVVCKVTYKLDSSCISA